MRFVLAVLVLACFAPAHAAEKKLNVLMIISDDLSPRLGCLGGPMVTPQIDRLAARGVAFEKAYCQFPLCAPSRASFMSGRRSDGTKVYANNIHLRDNLPDAVTMGQMFQQAGYFSGRVGKVFHYGVPKEIGTDGAGDDAPTWNEKVNPAGIDVQDENEVVNYMPNAKKAPPGERPSLGAALSWRADKGGDELQTDGKIALEAIKMIDRHRAPGSKPFFIVAGFFRPHVPDVGPEKYWSLYPADSAAVQLPKEPADIRAGVPPIAFYVKEPGYGIPEENLRQFLRGYYACTSFMDAQVGVLLDALDQRQLNDDTIVLFFSDHGWLLGEHGGQWQKMSLFDWSARVPLVIAAPGMKGNGKKSPRTVELVDIYPTLADLCGIKPTAKLDGESLRPLLDNPTAEWDHPAFTQVTRGAPVGTDARKGPPAKRYMGRSMRTDQYRYTHWEGPGGGEELYDLEADPKEWKNLADDPAHAALKAKLRARLEAELTGPYQPFGPAGADAAAPAPGNSPGKGKAKGKKKQ